MYGSNAHVLRGPLLVVLSVLFTHGQAQQPATKSEENRSGIINGRVVNESGQPMIGATVFVRPAAGAMMSRNTTTNAEGNFQVSGLEPAQYFVNANSPAYIAPQIDADIPLPTYRVGDSVRLELIRGGVITGTVTNATGDPLVGVRVRALMVRDIAGKPLRSRVPSWGERTTDDRGIYRIYGLAPGTFIVQAGGGGAGSGNVSDFDAPTYAPSSTRDSATEFQVRSGEETTADIRYRGEPGHVISGTIKVQGTSGASVTLSQVGDGLIPTNQAYQPPGARGFSIYGVSDGEYQLVGQEFIGAVTNFISNPDISISDPVKVTVRGADVTGLEIIPKPLAAISGRVALEPANLPECRNKRRPLFSETIVMLAQDRKESQNDPFAAARMFTSMSTPDKDGNFTMKNIRHGAYSVSPQFFARYWYLKSVSIAAQSTAKQAPATRDAARNWLPIKSGERVTGLTVTLSEGAGSVRGQITVAEDSKLEPGFFVFLVPAERDKVDDPFRYFVGQVGSDNSFSLGNLPPGRYSILAQKPQVEVPTTTDKLRLPDALEARTKIRRAAESNKADVELKPCQNVTDYKLALKNQ